MHFVNRLGEERGHDFRCTAKFRYRAKDVPVTVHFSDDFSKVTVDFDEPARAITPGQALVLYDGEECIGGGIIDAAYSESNQQLQYV